MSPGEAGNESWHLTTRERVSETEAAAVLAAADAAARSDKVSPLSEQVRLHLRYRGAPSSVNLLMWQDGELLGFAHLSEADPVAGRSGELFVHPAHRQHGLGRALAGAVAGESGSLPVRVWAHGDLPAAARLAKTAGFTRARALWRMHRPLRDPLAEPRFGDGIRVRTFTVGQDEDEWLGLNGRAFAGHPEQGKWSRLDLERREAEPWFDPDGLFLAERDGRLAGFHWTKVHLPSLEMGQPVGEVYVIGVDPAEQGTGLGRALTLLGLHHLRDRGIAAVMLYVEADNAPAIRLYTSLGFTHTMTDVMYEHQPHPDSGRTISPAQAAHP